MRNGNDEHDYRTVDDKKLRIVRECLRAIKNYPEHWRKFKDRSYDKNAFALQTKSSTFRDRILEQLVDYPPMSMGEFNMQIMGERGIMSSDRLLDFFYYRSIMFLKYDKEIGLKNGVKKKK